ncbi:non-specific lipid transfer protein GPI-anchored 19-like [Dioscorea cayenensis subsp. rotundata]|uniref:Non-specific lipid transfer protein GPI-anchored 19-like n=1 Tax=Dioscorea cayennensis subsp. rotundata TaxID=55577 RepID=A0AB40CK64_DIOCR|nr:non-specific lipid transfer protein GPI-anchored 19-like [Dioscorea cayenensis subsp. rotundata]
MVVAVVLRVTVLVVIFGNTVGEIQCESNDFMSVIASLSQCLNYLNGQSDTPTLPCCTQIAAVVKLNPECLCEVLQNGGGASAEINKNTTRALELPAVCNVTTAPASECNGTVRRPSCSPYRWWTNWCIRCNCYCICCCFDDNYFSYNLPFLWRYLILVEPDNFRRIYNQERAAYA